MKVKVNRFDKSKLESTTGRIEVNEKVCYDRLGNPMCSCPASYEFYLEIDGNWSCNWFGTKGKFYKVDKEW